jgi:uncharacterized protein
MLVYLDSSVLARAYLRDEPGHAEAAAFLDGEDVLVAGTLTVIEVNSALIRADRANRVSDLDRVLRAFNDDIAPDGAVTVITAEQTLIENSALAIVRRFGIRTLDAWHLAVADLSARQLAGDDEPVAFASRDQGQRAAADALGFALA